MNHMDHRSFGTTAAFENARVDVWSIERNAMHLRSGFAGTHLAKLGRALAALPRHLATAMKRRRTIAELSDLDDRLLADVGIRREDIVGLVTAGEQRAHPSRQDAVPAAATTAPTAITTVRPAAPANTDHAVHGDRQVA